MTSILETKLDLLGYFSERISDELPGGFPELSTYYLADMLSRQSGPPEELLGVVLKTEPKRSLWVAENALMMAGPWYQSRRILKPGYYLDLVSIGYSRNKNNPIYGRLFEDIASIPIKYSSFLTRILTQH